jgi:hypothetical protein
MPLPVRVSTSKVPRSVFHVKSEVAFLQKVGHKTVKLLSHTSAFYGTYKYKK